MVSYRPRGGMMALAQRMLGETRIDVHLSSRVVGITDRQGSMEVVPSGRREDLAGQMWTMLAGAAGAVRSLNSTRV